MTEGMTQDIQSEGEIIRTTTSICPECLQPIPAEIYVDPETDWVMMRKTCKDHGDFKDKLAELGHFPTIYKNIADLQLQFKNQLEKVLAGM